MKKVICIIIAFLYVQVSQAQQLEIYKMYEIKILSKLVTDVTKRKNPKVYFIGLDREEIRAFKNYTHLKITLSANDADFIFVKNLSSPLKINKPVFSLDFKSLKYCKNCFGVFSWRNGRPMLIIFREVINALKINLPEEYDYFIDSKKYILSG
ncbi:hypothetical protein [Persephonella sp.]